MTNDQGVQGVKDFSKDVKSLRVVGVKDVESFSTYVKGVKGCQAIFSCFFFFQESSYGFFTTFAVDLSFRFFFSEIVLWFFSYFFSKAPAQGEKNKGNNGGRSPTPHLPMGGVGQRS